jgi:hypothetical protein
MDGRITWLVQDGEIGLDSQLNSIISSLLAGVGPLMDAKDVESLRKMYDLLDRVDALEPLKLAFAKSVEV